MKTKIVYAIVCGTSNNFIEQAVISACSVKMYNPTSQITVVVDDKTESIVKNGRDLLLKYVDDLVVVKPPESWDNRKRSRYIKTNLRNLIEGDYLFIDTDTIITGSLQEVDDFSIEMGAVLDMHVYLNETKNLDMVEQQAALMGWSMCSKDYEYYNSGVTYVKDTPATHELYTLWYNNWLKKAELGYYTDQPALAYANAQMGYLIREISGKWNTQIMVNGLPYLSDSLVIHYFSSGTSSKHSGDYNLKLQDPRILEVIRDKQAIPEYVTEILKKPKEMLFTRGKNTILAGEDYDVYAGSVVQFVYSQYYYYPKSYKILLKLVSFYLMVKNIKNRLKK